MAETKKKSTWDVLSVVDCNEHTEQKNGLTYLSWAWAWGYVKKNFPSANYKVRQYDGRPYLFDENLGYLITTEVTIDNETIEMSLPVMDSSNKAQKHVAYTYGKYNKTVEPATMFDINTAIMRCLTKNLAMFGLGHYIYAGEDLPKDIKSEATLEAEREALLTKLREQVNAISSVDDLKVFFQSNVELQKDRAFIQLITERKKQLLAA